MRRGYASRFRERLGFLPRSFLDLPSGSIWLHAVSVGEVTSLVPLLRLVQARFPDVPLYLSTSTVAGRQIAERQTASLVDGIFFLPFDFGFCVRRVFRVIRPALLVIVETELWPNLFAVAHYSGTSLAIINGRISDRTWPTYRKWKSLFRSLLGIPALVQVQSETDRARYEELGVSSSSLLVDGNLKFDAALPPSPSTLPTYGAEQIWIAASTVGPNERGSIETHSVEEDDLVLATFQQLATEFPKLLLILAPRQPARFEQAAAKLLGSKLNFQRRSKMQGHLQLPGVLLLDTMGELAGTYPLASVVFVGGSLAPRGGHNIIEPAVAGAPIIVGPNMQNFEAITRIFLEAKAILQIRDAAALTPAVRSLLLDRAQANRLGQNARTLVAAQRGVSQRALERLIPLYFLGSFRRAHSFPIQLLCNALAALWAYGGRLKRQQGERLSARRPSLRVPVISVGGLTVGGAGKTPFTVALARLLRENGTHPGILTRGYKRSSNATIIAAPGAQLAARETGDEAQILLRSQVAPVGIAADRYSSALKLLGQFRATDILLLDDGFQHARLHRDIDIVLLDGLDPFANGQVIPAGRLREPLSALGRAHFAVITRCPADDRFAAIASKIRDYNPDMQVFRTDTFTRPWRNSATGKDVELPSAVKAGAFCALGNPESFWWTLDSLSIHTVFRKAFRDHHRYTRSDLTSLVAAVQAKGANLLLTTEKDFFNMPEVPPGVEVLYLPIEFVIRDADRLVQLLKRAF